jgi:hypothetical protein
MTDEELLKLRMTNLEALVRQAVPAVRGACKREEKKAADDRKNAPAYFLMHLDRAVLWRAWLNQAELLIQGLTATMPEDVLGEFHNRDDVAELARLQGLNRRYLAGLNDAAARGLGSEWLEAALTGKSAGPGPHDDGSECHC